MDPSAVTKAQTELGTGSRTTTALLDRLATKLGSAAGGGDQRARAWQLDLREVALSAREEASLAASLVGIAGLGNPSVVAKSMTALADRAAQTETLLTRLMDKVKAAADLGDLDAREWHLDLREAAFALREQSRVATALASAATKPEPASAAQSPNSYQQQYPPSPYSPASGRDPQQYAPQPQYAPPPQYAPSAAYGQPQQGGFFNRLMGSGFGQAMAMGAGFAVGEEVVDGIIDDIF
jgi:hypothetical protein